MARNVPVAAALDTAIVVAFVAIGRRNHDRDEAVSGLVGTAAPFLIGLAVAWLAWRVWQRPVSLPNGVAVWATTLAIGMLLRGLVFDDGTAASFVVVAATFLGVFLVGWRAVATRLDGRRLAA
ncbi:MAG: DUF3054 domain-containing protein [Actinomycetota bacterium]